MEEGLINPQRAVIAHDQAPEIAEPSEGAFDGPAPFVTPQRPAVLCRRLAPILAVRSNQLDPTPGQLFPQRVAVVAAIGNQPHQLLPRTTRPMPRPYLDGRQRRFDAFDFRRGRRVKVVSQRNTLAVDHHHPLCPLAPLGFSDPCAPFFAGAKLPSRNASLHFNCCRSFNSAQNARHRFNHTPCSSQSLSRRQQVDGDGNASGKPCQRAPLRSIHKMPSNTLRSLAGGRPPRGRAGCLGSKGRIFSHWASVSNRPYRAIRPPPAGAVGLRNPFSIQKNYRSINPL